MRAWSSCSVILNNLVGGLRLTSALGRVRAPLRIRSEGQRRDSMKKKKQTGVPTAKFSIAGFPGA